MTIKSRVSFQLDPGQDRFITFIEEARGIHLALDLSTLEVKYASKFKLRHSPHNTMNIKFTEAFCKYLGITRSMAFSRKAYVKPVADNLNHVFIELNIGGLKSHQWKFHKREKTPGVNIFEMAWPLGIDMKEPNVYTYLDQVEVIDDKLKGTIYRFRYVQACLNPYEGD